VDRGSRWALLVGANTYADSDHYAELSVCVEDVKALHSCLLRGGFSAENLRVLTDETPQRPLRSNILHNLRQVVGAAEADDVIVLYYSGHGDYDDESDTSYLVAHDGYRRMLADTAIPVSMIRTVLEESKARAKVLILDSCHSGADLGKAATEISPGFIERVFAQARGLVVLSSCAKGQLSYQWKERERSVFTHYLVEALDGGSDLGEKGFVTVQDAQLYVTDQVKRWGVAKNLIQTPTYEASLSGDIVLTLLPTTAAGAPARRLPENPFRDLGRITDEARFFDREALIREILNDLGNGTNVAIIGPARSGKSSLLTKLIAEGGRTEAGSTEYRYLNMAHVENDTDFYEALCVQLGLSRSVRGWRLTRELEMQAKAGKRVVLCLDEVERMSWEGFTPQVRSHLRGMAEGANAPLKLVVASQLPLSQVFRDDSNKESPLDYICRPIHIKPFPADVARAFLLARLAGTDVEFPPAEIDGVLERSRGHVGDLQLEAASVFERLRGHRDD
jgi:hypothetical protein